MLGVHFKVIDAFSSEVFKGNPTPVLVLEKWPQNELLLKVANEFNQSETSFLVKRLDSEYEIKWFTPFQEEPFCGHACLASMMFLDLEYGLSNVTLYSESYGGISIAASKVQNQVYQISLPVERPSEVYDPELVGKFAKAVGGKSDCINYLGLNGYNDYVIEVDPDKVDISLQSISASVLLDASPPGTRSQVLTARGLLLKSPNNASWLKRVFAYGGEDQATGSTYCCLVPYWAEKLNQTKMTVFQCSKRTGCSEVRIEESKVVVTGTGRVSFEGKIWL